MLELGRVMWPQGHFLETWEDVSAARPCAPGATGERAGADGAGTWPGPLTAGPLFQEGLVLRLRIHWRH